MKTNIPTQICLALGFLFTVSTVKSQMFVSPNSSVYVSNEVVYIKSGLELNGGTSNFYLRNDGQLLQGSAVASTNKGLGNLSVYQEGSTNNFQYNYWCSPVGGNDVVAGNSNFGITQLNDVTTNTTSTAATILPSNNYDGTASPLGIAPYWIWKLPSLAASNWVYVGSGSTLAAGEGFTMKGTSGTNATAVNGVQNNPGSKQRYDFKGKPNDGTITIPVLAGKLVLTGNPYPSAIDLSTFLLAATNTSGIAYFWEQDKTNNTHYIASYKGGYGTYSPMGGSGNGVYSPATFYTYDGSGNQVAAAGTGATYERRFSPIGQGFMIAGTANGNVEMKNSFRVFVKEGSTNFSQFERKENTSKTTKNTGYYEAIASVSGFDYTTISTAPTPQIRLNAVLNSQGVRQIVVAFAENATDGLDHAMDAASTGVDAKADAYFVVEDRSVVINAMQMDIDKKIPLGFTNNAEANYKIMVNEIINLDAVDNVFLHDKITNEYFDIKNNFHEMTLPQGVNNTQFEITFKNGSTLGVDDVTKENLIMYQDNNAKNLKISNPLQKELVSCSVYDIVGKLIFSKAKLGSDSNYNFSTSGLSDGIYIVKLITDDKVDIGQKIIIRN
ncbi:hypothetical protein HNQ02_003016 [Flavobacterium sp. 7E]|uniref:T9SS type A sorting domain-containing protein n=1 Tax=Flavobacterium sp. 7E TaxID=2735898 RepID=UPI00156FF281|nr:T9SS type A sorting domain-containing protein [Flavobacterium sp. 7E]NRS90081.1 hypothetical protein [Flavobacterium sp. 7E]